MNRTAYISTVSSIPECHECGVWISKKRKQMIIDERERGIQDQPYTCEECEGVRIKKEMMEEMEKRAVVIRKTTGRLRAGPAL